MDNERLLESNTGLSQDVRNKIKNINDLCYEFLELIDSHVELESKDVEILREHTKMKILEAKMFAIRTLTY